MCLCEGADGGSEVCACVKGWMEGLSMCLCEGVDGQCAYRSGCMFSD